MLWWGPYGSGDVSHRQRCSIDFMVSPSGKITMHAPRVLGGGAEISNDSGELYDFRKQLLAGY